MKVFYFSDVVKFLNKINIADHTRVTRTRELFEQRGFNVGQKYLKKITKDLWELRAGKIRMFLHIREDKAFGVHIIYKKSQKLPKNDIKLAEKRIS